jgi:hypothetical protein
MTDRPTGSDVTPNGVPLRVRMRNRKLRNIRPSGAFDQNWRYETSPEGAPLVFRMRNRKLRNIRPSGVFDQSWRYETSPVVTEGVPLGVRMRNRKLRNILPSVCFWPEVTSTPIGLPLEAGGVL